MLLLIHWLGQSELSLVPALEVPGQVQPRNRARSCTASTMMQSWRLTSLALSLRPVLTNCHCNLGRMGGIELIAEPGTSRELDM